MMRIITVRLGYARGISCAHLGLMPMHSWVIYNLGFKNHVGFFAIYAIERCVFMLLSVFIGCVYVSKIGLARLLCFGVVK